MIPTRIDFAVIITAENCNPNADPNSGTPRQNYEGYGLISDVAIKRKIRNRLMDLGQPIFVVPAGQALLEDNLLSYQARVNAEPELERLIAAKDEAGYYRYVCSRWYDVRAFGQIFAFKSYNGVTIGVRGPVSISIAKSLDVVLTQQFDISRSCNYLEPKRADKSPFARDSTVLGSRYLVEHGVYVAYGGIYPQLAERTGFDIADLETLKEALRTLLVNDASTMRPLGSMESQTLWITHNSRNGDMSPAEVRRALNIRPSDKYPYYTYDTAIFGDRLEVL